MTDTNRQKILFIINPVSGVRRKGLEEFKSQVEEFLDMDRFEAIFRVTTAPGSAAKYCREGLDHGVDIFVAVGGDGTLNEVGSVIAGTAASMGIIPAGSGNGLAHHLGIPGKTGDAVELINRNKTNRIDTCLVNDAFFMSIAGIGFDARVARQFAKSGQRGFKTYARIAMMEYFNYKPRKYKLILDGDELNLSAFFISFANSNQFGYNALIAPKASLTDGKLDVCIVKKPPVQAFPAIAHMMFTRKIDQSKYMEVYRASRILVERKKGRTVNIDGEAVRLPKKLDIRVRPTSLNVIVP